MGRPSFQFYPADWRNNANLRRCSDAARGAWMDILCVLHDSDEYGAVRWPLAELARAAGVALKLAKELADKLVLKGADRGSVVFTHTPRHAGKDGEPINLVEGQGPIWFSSRMVKDEWRRGRSGGDTKFTTESQPSRSPSRRLGDDLGDGASTSSSTPSSERSSLRSDTADADPVMPANDIQKRRKSSRTAPEIILPDWIPPDKWQAFRDMRRSVRAAMTPEAERLLILKLEGFRAEGQDIVAIINQSIENSYKGLFPVKQSGGSSNVRSERKQSAHDKFLEGAVLAVEFDRRVESPGGGDPEQAGPALLASRFQRGAG